MIFLRTDPFLLPRDCNYNRVKRMTDGVGETDYTYYPVAVGTLGAGKLQTTSGPLPNSTITLQYDELGRVVGQDINGTPATASYDSLGRMNATDNALGSFPRGYDGVTPRLLTLNYPNGQLARYTYFDNLNDRRLQTIENLSGIATNLSRHDYTYDATGQIQSWGKALGASENYLWFEYDDANQLISATQVPGVGFGYGYDAAGNRLNNTFMGAANVQRREIYSANNLNQLDTVWRDSGFAAEWNETFFTYDANGNMTSDGENRTFEWDGANRLVAINYMGNGRRTEFAYDGLGRRVQIIEKGPRVTAVVQPVSGSYSLFTTAQVTLPPGNYTIRFEGLDPTGGDNTMLLDRVALNNALVPDGGFESPVVDQTEFNPSGTAWTYDETSGVTANGSKMTSFSPVAPEGNQVAFIQGNGIISQSLNLAFGTYTLSFNATQLGNGLAVVDPIDPIDGGGPVSNETSQQIRVTLEQSVDTTTVKTFVWSGNTIAEERDAAGTAVSKRFFAEGEQRIGGTDAGNYYYSRDHLGSLREVTDGTGALKAQYDYDAWGNQVVVTGNMSFDFGYTGHYRHAASNLYLAPFRAYDPTMGRWLSRDPIKEDGGLNLYGYVRNNPVHLRDPLGLAPAGEEIIVVPHFAPDNAAANVGAALRNVLNTDAGQHLLDVMHSPQVPVLPIIVDITSPNMSYFPQGPTDTLRSPLVLINPNKVERCLTTEGEQAAPLEAIIAHELAHAILGLPGYPMDDPRQQSIAMAFENLVRSQLTPALPQRLH
jgi:RHS repeat-associated protein